MKCSPSRIAQFGGVVVASSHDISLSRIVTFRCVLSRNLAESYSQMSLRRIAEAPLGALGSIMGRL